MPDRPGAVLDTAVIVLGISGDQQIVKFLDGIDDNHRDAVVATEPAALTLDTALVPRRQLRPIRRFESELSG
jgi:hypothetical protein